MSRESSEESPEIGKFYLIQSLNNITNPQFLASSNE